MGPVLVCVGSSPTAEFLIEQGFVQASRLGVDLVAVHVRTAGDAGRQDQALRHLRQAQLMGARVIELSAADTVEGLLNLSRSEGVSLVVLGKPLHGTYPWPARSIADRFIRRSRTTPVLLVGDPHPPEMRHHAGLRHAGRGVQTRDMALLLLGVGLLTVLARVVPPSLSLLTAAICTIGLGRTLRPAPATLFGLVLGFVPALHVALGASPQTAPLVYLVVAPALIALIGALISRLQARIPEQERAILEREGQLSRLHAIGTELAATADAANAWSICKHALEQSLDARVECWTSESEVPDGPWRVLLAEPASTDEAVGTGTRTHAESPRLVVPVRTPGTHFGWFGLDAADSPRLEDVRTLLFVGSVSRLLGVTLERLHLSRIAEERRLLAASERLRSDLLSSVSHDLRTPLGTIVGAASWLRESRSAHSAETVEEFLESIEVEALRLERTLDNLLALTRLSGRPEADRTQWYIEEEIVLAALDRLGQALDRSRVTVNLSEERPLLAVDALLVELALTNLLDNAMRHGGGETRVRVVSRIKQGCWLLTVEDSGRGIPEQEREAVFERFFQGSWGRARRGSGMGLAICRAVAQAHGGDAVLVEPGDPDRTMPGACVQLLLPTEVLAQDGLDMESDMDVATAAERQQ